MMYAAQPEESMPMTEAEYLAFEASSEARHEYSRGRIYAMTGGSVRHSIITANTIIHLGSQLADRDCIVTSPDARLYIASRRAYRYPDVMVFCGQPAYVPGRTDTLTNPVVLVEVLSPSTALLDRNEKLQEYTLIDTLHAYLLVAQHEARIECYRRQEAGDWLYSVVTGLASDIALPAIGCTLALAKVYQKVTFDLPERSHDD